MNRPEILEFAPSRLKCLDIILQNQNDSYISNMMVIKVRVRVRDSVINPIVKGGETVS